MERLYRRVWVLGAGFSRSLGGPTLANLFVPEPWFSTLALCPEEEFKTLAQDINTAKVIFNWGRTTQSQWTDAEQFLAFVDAARGGDLAKARLLQMLANTAQEWDPVADANINPHAWVRESASDLRRIVRRALATETSMFSIASELSDEQSIPYLEWVESLDPAYDTVVTFNYDLTLELLGAAGGDKLAVLLPDEEVPEKKVPVFKLHGSVDWTKVDKGIERVDRAKILKEPGFVPEIAAPGRSKAPGRIAPFPKLWTKARLALERASWVGFIGYRFPPTDALAVQFFRQSLAGESGGAIGYGRRFEIVLGDNIQAPEVQRLQALLGTFRYSRRVPVLDGAAPPIELKPYLRIVRQPLFAEDFLGAHRLVIDHNELLLR